LSLKSVFSYNSHTL